MAYFSTGMQGIGSLYQAHLANSSKLVCVVFFFKIYMSVYIFVFFVNDMPEQLFFSFVGHDTYKGVCGEKVGCVVSVATWHCCWFAKWVAYSRP